MERGESVLLACRISRGGFSGERVFRLSLADGTEHVGVAPVGYFFHRGDRPKPIEPNEPPHKGQPIEGLIAGRIVVNGGDTALVAVPDGETIEVKLDRIAFERRAAYVPVGS